LLERTARTTTLSLMTKKTRRGKRIQAPMARMSNAKSEVEIEWVARANIRRTKYSKKMKI
jgi:hypothetical protein